MGKERMSFFRLAYLSFVRKKLTTAIALISIALSVACGGLLLRLNILSNSRFSSIGKSGTAIVGAKSGEIDILLNSSNSEGEYPGFLPKSLYDSLKSEMEKSKYLAGNTLHQIVPVLYFAKYKSYRIMGTDEEFFNMKTKPIKLKEGRWSSGKNEIVLGAKISNDEGLRVGNHIKLKPWVQNGFKNKETDIADTLRLSVNTSNLEDFEVVGILDPTSSNWDQTLFSNLDMAKTFIEDFLKNKPIWGVEVLNYFFIDIDPEGFPKLESLINERTVSQVVFVQKTLDDLGSLTGSGKRLGLFVLFFIMALGGLSVSGVLMTRFESMTVQLAVLRAIGYTRFEVIKWLIWEGVFLGIFACLLGALLDGLTFPFLRRLMGSTLPNNDLINISIFQSAPIWVIAVLSIMLAVLIPLIRIYKQDIHFTLRS